MSINYIPSEEQKMDSGLYQTPLPGVFFIPYTKHTDDRGFYTELARLPEIERTTNKPFVIKQLNLSHSKKNVIRGFHAENWRKLITVLSGEAYCAFADLRPKSPKFGRVMTVTVGSEADNLQGSFYLPAGIGNSFLVTKEPLDYLYGVDQLYSERDTSGDIAISLFDPDLNVDWPIAKENMIISSRDQQAVTLREKFPQQFNQALEGSDE